jgi:hypothetical protein
MSHWDVGKGFCVEGIVDLEAISEHKRHLPIGRVDNPTRLIKFKDLSAPPPRKPLNKKQNQQRKKLLERKLEAGRQDSRQNARDGA